MIENEKHNNENIAMEKNAEKITKVNRQIKTGLSLYLAHTL